MSKNRKHVDFRQPANGGVAVSGKEDSPQVERRMPVIMSEISVIGNNMYGVGLTYNPDDLVGKKGLEIYKKMRIDDQIKAVLTMKKMAMLSTGWDVHSASQEPDDVEKREFVKWNLGNLVGTLEDHLFNLFTAYDFGFALAELVWYRIEKGKWAGRIGLKALKTREPFFYLFDSDAQGNLADDGIVYMGSVPDNLISIEDWQKPKSNMGTRYPVNKFVIFSYNKEFSNWYGQSDLRSAFRSWWSKEILIRFMNIYAERFGMPTHVAKFPPGMSKPDRDDLKKVIDQVQAKYGIVIPNDVTIDLLQAGAGGWEGFRSAIEMHNKFMARSILVPDLMGYTEMQGGAYALGKKHFDMFLWIINRGQRDEEESIMGEQVIKRLIDLNWADTEDYPKFKFGSLTEEGSQAKSTILSMALTAGLVNREEMWIRDYLGLPAKDPNIELPELPMLPQGGSGLPPEITERLKGLEAKVDEVKGFFTELKLRKLIIDFKEDEPKTVKVKPTKFDKKLNYVELKKTLDDYEEESIESMSAIVKRMRDDMVRFVRRRKIIEDKDAAGINKLQLKYVGELKRDIEARLVKLYLDSKLNAAKVLQNSGVKMEIVTKFQDVSIPDWEPVPPADAIDFFKKKVLVKVIKADGTKVLVELATGKVLDYYTQKAFYVAGVERDYILKEAKASLLASLQTGDSVDTAVANLGKVFDKYIERGELDDEGDLITAHRLETIVRTNYSEAFNRGMRDFIDDNEITDFVPYLVYSAILDSRVRESHAALNGKIFREDDPDIENIIPGGYNCRCFPRGTMIAGEGKHSGIYANGVMIIERIEKGDYVYTHEERFRKVVKTYKEFYEGDLIVIKTESGREISPTPKHEILTANREWIKAGKLNISDILVTLDMQEWVGEKLSVGGESRIVEIKRKKFRGYVYNLEVDTDESYFAEGVAVHNCTWIPLTQIEVDDMVKAGGGVKVSTKADFPPDFPDPGFKSFSESPITVKVTSPEVDEDGGAGGDHEDFIRFDSNSSSEWGHYRLINPASFKKDSITTWDTWAEIETKGVKFIVGDLNNSGKKAVQAIRFSKDSWTEDKATEWWNTHKDKFEKTWTQSDWDKAKYTVTYNGLTSDPSSYAEAVGYQKAVKMMGHEVEIMEV